MIILSPLSSSVTFYTVPASASSWRQETGEPASR